ncbi:MAG: AAA family ATPase [Actinobacteria bacterium]|nr:AAA family ATPase [Actinomycetota bacterium]
MSQGGDPVGRRSTAIVLFTDLVGSTELRAGLGEDAAENVRRSHDRLVGDAITASGGQLVKNLGDGVMATFSGASDAVTAAVCVQQALDRHNRSATTQAPLHVRIGISAGDVTIEEGDYFGTPVVEAARLCAVAKGGQILVSEVVRWLAGSAGGHRFTSVGALDLRGLPAALPSCEVGWEPQTDTSIPMPPLLTGVGRVFVGRDDELERLSRLWKETAAGERRVALLAGEPGIGKTRLAAELAGQVHQSGGLVLAGRCDEDLGVPFQPFVEALRHYVTHAAEHSLGRHAGELTRLLPDLPQFVAGLAEPLRSDPETERYRLFDAVAAWLVGVSAERPVLLILDDLHWAAKPTLLMLRHVVRSAGLRLMVVATYRDSDIGRGHAMSDFLADLRREGGIDRMSLLGLDTSSVTAFMEAVAGHTLEEDEQALPAVVWRETEGNPFFVSEVLRHLAETRVVEQRAGRWVLTSGIDELGIPEGVRDVVGRRLSRLPDSTNRVLSVASVVGLEFQPAVVGHAGEVSDGELLGALEEAAAARLLAEVPGARYRFAHALVRATLYDELSGPRRVALHRRVAEAIEALHADDLDDHLPALAHHWARTSVPVAESARAVDYAARAGDRAMAQLAHDEAAGYYRQALELLGAARRPDDDPRRGELLISLGEAQHRAGDAAHRETLLEAARLAEARGDVDALARAVLANHRGLLWSTAGLVDTDRVAVLEAALRAIGDDDSAARARLLANLALELIWGGERERRVRLSDEALVIARRLGDKATLAHVLVNRFYAISAPTTLSERMAEADELLALSERLGDPVIALRASSARFRAALEAGDVVEADHCVAACERLAAELNQPALRWVAMMHRAGRVLQAGRIDEAEQLADEAAELGRIAGQADTIMLFPWQRITIGFERGRIGDVAGEIAGLRARMPGVGPVLSSMLAVTWAELGERTKAEAAFEELAASGFVDMRLDSTWLVGITNASLVCAFLGDTTRASALSDLLAPYPDQFPVAALGMTGGSVSYYLGLLAAILDRHDAADARFRAAAETHTRIGAPTWLARTELEWGRLLLHRDGPGDRAQARQLLGQALDTAQRLDLATVGRRATTLLNEDV